MSDRAMDMAMQLFRTEPEFQRRVRDSDDKGAAVNQLLREFAPRVGEEKSIGAADDGLDAEEQAKINGLPWDSEDDAQLISRIGQAGCTYT
ncbi:MAG: hypothetical protein AB7R89_14340 [Dehalococcoidia bacterium]